MRSLAYVATYVVQPGTWKNVNAYYGRKAAYYGDPRAVTRMSMQGGSSSWLREDGASMKPCRTSTKEHNDGFRTGINSIINPINDGSIIVEVQKRMELMTSVFKNHQILFPQLKDPPLHQYRAGN